MSTPLHPEPEIVGIFKQWLVQNGATIHDAVHFEKSEPRVAIKFLLDFLTMVMIP